jgi:hypothetical protein
MPMAQYAAAALNAAISTPREREVQRRVGRSILDRSGRCIEGAGSEAAWVAAAEKISAAQGWKFWTRITATLDAAFWISATGK